MTENSAALVRMPAQLQRLRGHLEPRLRRWVQAAFDAADDELFEQADSATSNQEQNDWFEAMRHIRVSRRRFEDQLLKHLESAFVALAENEIPELGPQWSSQDWQWLDQAALEAGISIDVRDELQAIEQELQSKGAKTTGEYFAKAGIPVSLSRLCLLFNQALPCLAVPPKAKEVLYRQFYLQLLRHLGAFYRSQFLTVASPGGGYSKELEASTDATISGDALIQTLSALNSNASYSDLDKKLSALKVSAQDRQVIDLIEPLFRVLLQAEGLGGEAVLLMQRLKLPVLALALRDDSFLQRHDHPARRLLNRLIGLAPEAGGLAILSDAVERIVSDVWINPLIFDAVFSDLEKDDKALSPEGERRLQDAESARLEAGRARAYVKQVVVDVLTPAAQGQPVPDAVARILRGPWHNVMLLTYLNEGEQSLLWRKQLHAARELVWSVCGKFESPTELMQRLPALLDTLRQGFDTIAHDAFELNGLLKELEALHLQRMTQSSVAEQSSDIEAVADAANGAPISSASDISSRSLKTGGWYERCDASGNWMRCRLAAVIKNAGLHIFVNSQGDKIAEMTESDVAQALADGSLKEMEGNQMFDRALESVITGLRASRH